MGRKLSKTDPNFIKQTKAAGLDKKAIVGQLVDMAGGYLANQLFGGNKSDPQKTTQQQPAKGNKLNYQATFHRNFANQQKLLRLHNFLNQNPELSSLIPGIEQVKMNIAAAVSQTQKDMEAIRTGSDYNSQVMNYWKEKNKNSTQSQVDKHMENAASLQRMQDEYMTTPKPTTPAQTTPAQTTPRPTTPAQTTPAQTTPAQTTPKPATPAQAAPAQNQIPEGYETVQRTGNSFSRKIPQQAQPNASKQQVMNRIQDPFGIQKRLQQTQNKAPANYVTKHPNAGPYDYNIPDNIARPAQQGAPVANSKKRLRTTPIRNTSPARAPGARNFYA
ncbi:MAG: hypothetical protein H8E55_46475 [Pelagibacterales bacterium]|nr:hypothetical protein [Pelagibacterales bacterium]